MKLSKSKNSPWRKMEATITDHLPIYDPNSAIGKKEISRSKSKEKLVHLIPLIVFICLFILWCLSYPVNLEIKDGRFTAAHRIDTSQPQPVSERLVDHTVLALGTTTNSSIPLILKANNNTEYAPQPAGETVNLEIKDGRFTAAHRSETSLSQAVTERLVDHISLAVGTTPNASIPLILMANNTESAPQPASESGT